MVEEIQSKCSQVAEALPALRVESAAAKLAELPAERWAVERAEGTKWAEVPPTESAE